MHIQNATQKEEILVYVFFRLTFFTSERTAKTNTDHATTMALNPITTLSA